MLIGTPLRDMKAGGLEPLSMQGTEGLDEHEDSNNMFLKLD